MFKSSQITTWAGVVLMLGSATAGVLGCGSKEAYIPENETSTEQQKQVDEVRQFMFQQGQNAPGAPRPSQDESQQSQSQ